MPRKPTPIRNNPTRQTTQSMRDELQELRTASLVHKALEGVLAGISEMKADIQDSASKLDAIGPQLEAISKQTTLTNGRVTNLEMWRAKSTGVMAAIAALASLIGWGISQGISFFKH